MTYGFGLGAGLSALKAARLAIQTAGHNVANANTEGYSRQRILQSATLPYSVAGFQIGTGVQVDDISRLIDGGIERRLRLQLGLTGAAEVDSLRWQEVEGVLDEPGAGLSSSLSDLFGRIGRLKTDPADRALRGGVVQGASALAQGLNLLSTRFGEMQSSTFDEVRGLTQQVNEHASAVATLNRDIAAIEGGGQTANDLRDARETHVKAISRLIDTRAVERDNGSVDLVAGGYLLVSGTTTTPLRVQRSADDRTTVHIGDSSQTIEITGGRIGALLRHETEHLPGLLADLDRLAKELALQFNRVQSTGVPKSGPFSELTAHYGVVDGDGDGERGDELLSQSGLPFDVVEGELWLTVRNKATGDIERTRFDIDPRQMSLRDLASAIDAVDHVNASVDPTGRLQITADASYGFDFGNHLDPAPDSFGSFGGSQASLGGSVSEPFVLTVPSSFTVNVNGSPQTVNLSAADFRNAGAATARELATAINAQLGGQATAKDVGGRLVIRSNTSGTSSTLALTDGAGAPLAALGMPTGVTATGRNDALKIEVKGTYTGSDNRRLTFRPDADGQIGVTPGLTVGVFDETGSRVATVQVGGGRYAPGDEIEVLDGIKVSFGPGDVSASNGNVFALDALADTDTTDVLVALGMNSVFWGNSASTLTVNEDLVRDPELLAAGTSGFSGDASNLQRLLDVRDLPLGTLGDASLEDFWAGVVGGIGFESSAAAATSQAQDNLLGALEAERTAVSGVDLDEEMIDLVRFQQAFQAASRFISTVSELSQTLVNLGS
ncbi:MAG: flagellar hook-associated protein FlgK [Planctomycetota bacterium]